MNSVSLFLAWVTVGLIAVSWFIVIFSPLVMAALIFLAAPTYFFWGISTLLPSEKRKNVRILLIDDQPSSLIVMEHIIKNQNIEYKIVPSGRAAIQEMAKNRYNLIVLDHEMPDISGPETLVLADNYSPKQGERNALKEYEGVPVLGYSTRKETEWDLPKLKRFKFSSTICKNSSYKLLQERLVDAMLDSKVGA